MEIAQNFSDNKQPQKEHKQFMLFHNVHFGAIYASLSYWVLFAHLPDELYENGESASKRWQLKISRNLW